MSEVNQRNRNGETVSLWGVYDTIVIGGGISGVCSARTIAAEGQRVALIEPTGTLGREITRAYNLFVRFPKCAEQSPSLHEYDACLRNCQGMFTGQLDPAAAALAFDELLVRYPITVLFHVWPSRLMTDGNKVSGLEAVCRSGRILLEAPTVIDASALGKVGRAWFRSSPANRQVSIVHLIYNGISGECPDETVVTLPGAGELRVTCRPTYWNNEWRVTLTLNRRRSRAEWQQLLEEVLISLRERIPAIRSGVLAHLSDDISGDPEILISTGSSDGRISGYVRDPYSATESLNAAFTIPISHGMLYNPDVVDGLFLAGPWLEGYPFDPGREETAVVNAFVLGDLAGRTALRHMKA